MTLRYRFLTDAKEWVVVGPARELRVGPVVVTKMDGSLKPETIGRLSKPYRVDGAEFRFGYILPLPKGRTRAQSAPLPPAAGQAVEPEVDEHALDLARRNQALMRKNAMLTKQLVRLLNLVMNMREDFADLEWPELPDTYDDKIWRAAS